MRVVAGFAMAAAFSSLLALSPGQVVEV